MAKDGGKGDKKAKRIPKRIAGVKLPKELRQKGEALLDRAASPEGLQAIAGALTLAATAAAAAAQAMQQRRPAGPADEPPPAAGAARPDAVADAIGSAANAVFGLIAKRKA